MIEPITISFARVAKARASGIPWTDIAEDLVGDSCQGARRAIQRCFRTKEDALYRPRKKRKQRATNGHHHRDLEAVNALLRASADGAAAVRAKVDALIVELRRRGVARLVIDVEAGEARAFTWSELFHVRGR